MAFARRRGGEWALVVAPRWLTMLECAPPDVCSCNWGDTALALPEGAPSGWTNAFTGAALDGLSLKEILRDFPVALLEGR